MSHLNHARDYRYYYLQPTTASEPVSVIGHGE